MAKRENIAIKIDVDTHDGMRDGVPVLLDILSTHHTKATFCLSFGPDYSGRAIFRCLKDPAFLKKMLGTGAPALYGWRTILSGTLLPARPIATAFPEIVRDIANHGHEVAVHAWNHRFWQDHLTEMFREQIRREFSRSFEAYESILHTSPHAVAAPGWQATPDSLEVEESLGLDWASDLREGPPCFLKVSEKKLSLLQIPTTGPCIEELLTQGIREEDRILKHLVSSQMGQHHPVLAVHAEVEGGHYAKLFNRLLPVLISSYKEIISIGDMARSLISDSRNIPVREFTMISLPGRAGMVASSK